MPATFEETLHAATSAWTQEGLVTPEQAERIRARHPLPAAGSERPSAVTSLLYAAAGILIGAAGIALIAVSFDVELDTAQLPFALVAVALVGAGISTRNLLGKPLLGDAFLVASLPPGVAAGMGEAEILSVLGLALALGLLVWRRDGGFVPTLAIIAFSVAAGIASSQLTEGLPDEQGQQTFAWTWVCLQAALLGALVASERAELLALGAAGAAFAVVALGVSFTVLLNTAFDLKSEGVELGLGALMLALVGAGAWLRHRGLVLGAAIVLCVDAIVFGFDVGGVLTGTFTLVAVAALLIWQAELVKRYFRG